MSLSVDIVKQLGSFRLHVAFDTAENPTGLLGASGCGKSVTLKCIAGIIRPDAGRIVLNGRVLFDSKQHINLPPQQRHVGYLFQNYALFPNMSVEQNVACGLPRQKDRRERARLVAEMLETMQLTELFKLRPHQLSGGQQQRAALARILVGSPEILMLDEPFSALDSFLTDRLRVELSAILTRFGKDTLLVTHSRDEAYELCRSLAVMDSGHIVRMGDTKAVFSDPGTRAAAVLTGCKNIVGAVKADDTRIFVPDWGVSLETGRAVPDELVAIGVRAHDFTERDAVNRFSVHTVEVREEPFAWNIYFRYGSQSDDTPPILRRLSKSDMPPAMSDALGIAPADILLLNA